MPKASAEEKSAYVTSNAKHRRINIKGYITPKTVTQVKRALVRLKKIDNETEILINISSEGGCFASALKLYNLIYYFSAPVNTVVVNYVNSGAFVVLQAGVRRFARKGAQMGFHPCADATLPVKKHNLNFNGKDYMRFVRESAVVDGIQMYIFSKRGGPFEVILQKFLDEEVLTPHQAKKLKLIDAIIS
jgi:ATP-dependent protease ClpP protease subunit